MSFWRNIARVIGQEIAKELSKVPAPEHEARALYGVYTVDLSQARANKEMPWGGDYLLVEYIDGELDCKLNRQDAPAIELDKMVFVASDFDKVYLSNSAQAGKSAKVYVGKQMGFSAQVGMRGVGYIQAFDVFRGGDDTEVSTYSTSWTLMKTITIVNLSSNRPLDKVLYETKKSDSVACYIRITVQQTGGSENIEVEEEILNTSYTWHEKALSTIYYGLNVNVRIYLKGGGGVNYTAYERGTKCYGYDQSSQVFA